MTSIRNLLQGLALGAACVLSASAASQQLAPDPAPTKTEDTITTCPLISPELQRKIGDLGKGQCQTSCKGCGCKGGPGYRGPNGSCVGYANIIQICGPPPHAGCIRECAIVRPGCQGRVWLKAFAAAAGLVVTFEALKPTPGNDATTPAREPAEAETQ